MTRADHDLTDHESNNQSDGQVDRPSAFGPVDLGFDSESSPTNDLKIGIHSFPACRSILKDSVEQTGKLACCAVGKGT